MYQLRYVGQMLHTSHCQANSVWAVGFPLRTSSHEAHAYRAGPKQVRALGRLIIWRPFKPIFFKLFLPRNGLANRACPNFGQFAEKVFRVCKPEFTGTYFRTSQCSFQVGALGRCQTGPLLYPVLKQTLNFKFLKKNGPSHKMQEMYWTKYVHPTKLIHDKPRCGLKH